MKKNITIKIVLALLAVVMAFSVVSCTQNGGNGDTTSATASGTVTQGTSTSDPWTIDGVTLDTGDKTYSNKEFNIYSRNASSLYENLYLSSDQITQSSTKVDIAVADRASYIEENLGVYISITGKVDYEQMNADIAAANTAGDTTKHLINNHGRKMLSAVLSGYFTSYDKLTYVNLKAPWWNQDATDTFTTPSGKVYATTGDLDYMSVGEAVGMYFNKTILGDIEGLESPYSLVKRDAWTFEKFEEYVKAADNSMGGDKTGNIATDYFGYSSGKCRGPVNVIYSAGSRAITKDASGDLKVTMKNNTVINAYDDYFTLLCKTDSSLCYCFPDTTYGPAHNAFKEGRIAFYDDIVDVARSTFRNADVDYGIVPWPKYDDTVDGYHCFPNANGHLYGVIKTFQSDDLEMISVVLETLAFLGSRDVINQYYDSVLSYQYFHSAEDVDMLKIIRKGIVFDLDYFFGSGVVDVGMNMCQNNYNTKFTATYETLLSKTQENIATWSELGF